jgi:beta-galactosidase/beta-glucuronidase
VSDGHRYPRPQLRRAGWVSLDGPWDFAIDREGRWSSPDDVPWDKTIQVPFAPETKASGIGDTSFFSACWYRRTVKLEPAVGGERWLLHFGAVDYAATVWLNGRRIAFHQGGYTPFTVDATGAAASAAGEVTVVVCAEDDPHDLEKPRGKQDWQLEPHSIWYPRTSGIWQSVWLEKVPATWLQHLRWTPNLERWEIGIEAWLGGDLPQDVRLKVELRSGGKLLGSDVYGVIGRECIRRIALSDPGVDDYRNEMLWSPHSPTLIGARIELLDAQGTTIDTVLSYTALRSIGVQGPTVVLNGRPYPLRFVLDQGYWPQSGMTPPDDDALRRDVELVKAMGFNGVRKHQKVECPRFLYWADRLGLLVWEEMPSAYRYTTTAVQRLTREWVDVVLRDISHPCVIAWVPFNESWGVPNLPEVAAQRHFVQALYHLTHTLDPTRLVIGNDGWESVATDIIGIHDYDDDPERLSARYSAISGIPQLFQRERPGGRALLLGEGSNPAQQPIMLTEFGGIACAGDEPGGWGYSVAESTADLATRYEALLGLVRRMSMFAGFCYTQLTDTYQERNGLLYFDRRPKFPIDQIAVATRGARTTRALQEDHPRQGIAADLDVDLDAETP